MKTRSIQAGRPDGRRLAAHTLEEQRTWLTAYCRRMVGASDAEDAVQETMLRAWRAQGDFEGRSSLATWLHRIARNVCLDISESRRRRAVPLDLTQDDVRLSPLGVAASEPDPSEAALTSEATRVAVEAAGDLPRRQRASLILCEVVGLRASEAAALVGTSVPSLNSSIQRARATLADRREGSCHPSPPKRDPALQARYVGALGRNDVEALVSLAVEDGRGEPARPRDHFRGRRPRRR